MSTGLDALHAQAVGPRRGSGGRLFRPRHGDGDDRAHVAEGGDHVRFGTAEREADDRRRISEQGFNLAGVVVVVPQRMGDGRVEPAGVGLQRPQVGLDNRGVRLRLRKKDVDPERPAGRAAHRRHVALHGVDGLVAGGQEADAAGVGHRRDQLGRRRPATHRRPDDRHPSKLTEVEHVPSLPAYPKTSPSLLLRAPKPVQLRTNSRTWRGLVVSSLCYESWPLRKAATAPPSTSMSAPVMNEARELRRNSVTEAMSSAVPRRPEPDAATIARMNSPDGPSSSARPIDVAITPGLMALMRAPRRPHGWAAARTRADTPALAKA